MAVLEALSANHGDEPSRVSAYLTRPSRPSREVVRSPACLGDGLEELQISYEAEQSALWVGFAHRQHPCFTPSLLRDIHVFQDRLVQEDWETDAVKALVWYSSLKGIFNLGGDLRLFIRLIGDKSRDELWRYARACIDCLQGNLSKSGRSFLTIGVVGGETMGGGFECLLTNDVVIAERQARFGLPEILFNLFPGMGAYSILSRRLDGVRAERMIRSGKVYGAEELADMGLVDLVVETGEGAAAAREYLDSNRRRLPLLSRLSEVRRRCAPITDEELEDVVAIWVETALALDPMDLRRMQRLADAQLRRWSAAG